MTRRLRIVCFLLAAMAIGLGSLQIVGVRHTHVDGGRAHSHSRKHSHSHSHGHSHSHRHSHGHTHSHGHDDDTHVAAGEDEAPHMHVSILGYEITIPDFSGLWSPRHQERQSESQQAAVGKRDVPRGEIVSFTVVGLPASVIQFLMDFTSLAPPGRGSLPPLAFGGALSILSARLPDLVATDPAVPPPELLSLSRR